MDIFKRLPRAASEPLPALADFLQPFHIRLVDGKAGLLCSAATAPTMAPLAALTYLAWRTPWRRPLLPELSSPVVDLSLYDQLLAERRGYEQSVY